MKEKICKHNIIFYVTGLTYILTVVTYKLRIKIDENGHSELNIYFEIKRETQ